MSQESKQETTTEKINKFLSKFAMWVVGIVLSLGGVLYSNMHTQVVTLEGKVSFLYQDKVGREELKYELGKVGDQINRGNQALSTSQDKMKNEILERLELILRFSTPKNPSH